MLPPELRHGELGQELELCSLGRQELELCSLGRRFELAPPTRPPLRAQPRIGAMLSWPELSLLLRYAPFSSLEGGVYEEFASTAV